MSTKQACLQLVERERFIQRRAKRRTKQVQNDACISFVLQGGVRPKVKVLHLVTFALPKQCDSLLLRDYLSSIDDVHPLLHCIVTSAVEGIDSLTPQPPLQEARGRLDQVHDGIVEQSQPLSTYR